LAVRRTIKAEGFKKLTFDQRAHRAEEQRAHRAEEQNNRAATEQANQLKVDKQKTLI
jgi:hypothetical protein